LKDVTNVGGDWIVNLYFLIVNDTAVPGTIKVLRTAMTV
jgi:hypothetical protein